ncbi:unnamed protein product [Cylicostephanus goldi]|uniref:Uncharacterized protein n=1 Tax=Cylicostephanus goldi TaxID=71465 RepID=A0A3P7QCM8_CYLGO|nr:unnamed protein product [Cylicostephanus goldi]
MCLSRTAATQFVFAVFHDENLPIASGHVVTPGKVNSRPEFNFEEAPSVCADLGSLAGALLPKHWNIGYRGHRLGNEINGIMTYMMAEIQCAKFDRCTRAVELSEKKDATGRSNGRPTLALRNCTQPWKLDGPAPFITADLRQMIVNYHPKERETPFQLFAGLFRYILVCSGTRAIGP